MLYITDLHVLGGKPIQRTLLSWNIL